MRPPIPQYTGQSFDCDPSSPRQSDVAFDQKSVETVSCMGFSLASVIKPFRNYTSPLSPPANTNRYESIFRRFNTLWSTVQSTMMCAINETYQPTSPKWSGWVGDDPRIQHDEFDCNTFRQDLSLERRAISWGTHDTATASGDSPLSYPSNHQVKFHNPPVTSVRLRSRTRTKDIDQLFFSPEELDEIKDDRNDTMMTDDIETLAVGEVFDWCESASSTSSSSVFSASDCDDQDSRSGLMLAETLASNVMFDRVGSPRRSENVSERKFVRGVQIMLREKSTDRSF